MVQQGSHTKLSVLGDVVSTPFDRTVLLKDQLVLHGVVWCCRAV